MTAREILLALSEGKRPEPTRKQKINVQTAILAALRMAASTRALKLNWIHHTDRDCRYVSDEYLAALKQLGALPSMSRKADCWDNAVSESFFATLEKELLALQALQSRSKTRKEVADYIDNYYNLVRLHSHLDYVSPVDFETNAPS